MQTDSIPSTQPKLPPRGPMLVRRSLGALAIVTLIVAAIGFIEGWPHVWAVCVAAGVLMLVDLRLMMLARPIAPRPAASTARRRVIAAIVTGLGLIAIAIAASLLEGWGWRIVGIGSLVAFALMTLIAMPLLAAASHDAAAER